MVMQAKTRSRINEAFDKKCTTLLYCVSPVIFDINFGNLNANNTCILVYCTSPVKYHVSLKNHSHGVLIDRRERESKRNGNE